MRGEAFVFLNLKQAAHFGHVGWGFALDAERYFFGSTDHLYHHAWWDLPGWIRYSRVPSGGDIDWWGQIGTKDEMLALMGPNRRHSGPYHIWYHLAKEIEVLHAQPERALAEARALERGGWSVLGNNCLQQAHRVLTIYGAQLPPLVLPFGHLLPKLWFNRLPGNVIELIR